MLLDALDLNRAVVRGRRTPYARPAHLYSSQMSSMVIRRPSRQSVKDSADQFVAGVVVQPRVRISTNTVVDISAVIEQHCVLGTSCFIGPRSVLSGRVQIDEEAFVGAGATILPGVKIGTSSVVGAGAVVTREVSAQRTVVGNPAREYGAPS